MHSSKDDTRLHRVREGTKGPISIRNDGCCRQYVLAVSGLLSVYALYSFSRTVPPAGLDYFFGAQASGGERCAGTTDLSGNHSPSRCLVIDVLTTRQRT